MSKSWKQYLTLSLKLRLSYNQVVEVHVLGTTDQDGVLLTVRESLGVLVVFLAIPCKATFCNQQVR